MGVSLVLVGLAALLVAFWIFISWHFNYWKVRGVPSCNPLSIRGDRGGGLPVGKPFYELLSPVYNKYKGSHRFVGTFQARQPVLVALEPELIKAILTKDFGSFPGRGQPNDETDPFSNNLFFLQGPRWKNLRTKLSPTFTSGKLKYMFPLMTNITDTLNVTVSKTAAKQPDREMDFKEVLVRYSTDVIGTVAFGLDCDTLSNGSEQFLTMSREIFKRNLLFIVRFFLISIHPIFTKVMPFKKMFGTSTRFFQTLMRDTVDYREKNKVERNDFVQLMMQLRAEDKNRSDLDRINHIEFHHDNMAAQAFLFFIAGLDNIANTVGFALHELAVNPELQQRAAEDVRAAKEKHGGMTYDALRSMGLIERIVREALRKYSPVGILTRQAEEPYKLPDSEVVIDKTAIVWIPVWQMLHDPEYFPDPDRFDPERFTEEAKQDRHHYAYLPFGEGPRFCIAERFAVLEMKLCLAGLLDSHRFEVGKKTDVAMKLDQKTGAPVPQEGFWLRVQDRE